MIRYRDKTPAEIAAEGAGKPSAAASGLAARPEGAPAAPPVAAPAAAPSPPKRVGGRPPKPDALTKAEKQRAYRARKAEMGEGL